MGGREIKGLKARVGQKCFISRGGPDEPGSTVEVYKLKKSEEEDKVLVGAGSSEELGREALGARVL